MERRYSVDVVRGAVMVLMALDHVRFFFNGLPCEPENLACTGGFLFLTRWVTHFCAPVFFLLAGTGAYLARAGGMPAARVCRFLWTRGLWLIALELTVIGFAWSFLPGSSFAGVIWALGWSMLVLAALVRLPTAWSAVFGVALITLHHLLDGVDPAALGRASWLWPFLHARGLTHLPWNGQPYFVLYPLIPSVGITAAGYALGAVLTRPEAARRRWLITAGLAMTAAFVMLRASNLYGYPPVASMHGAPASFEVQATPLLTVIAFLDTEKYPMSLQFILMTLGPALVVLGLLDGYRPGPGRRGWPARALLVFGRVPMAFYILHLYLIHLLAIGVAMAWGQPAAWLWQRAPRPHAYGHGLLFIYAMWVFVTLVLYVPCRWFEGVKRRHRWWWLRYL
ncbi:MAG: heparan-alpha-glucosaminide N-acetyltransferase domain-containing protein [Candidatus Krumholzibacteria bacterium]|nr:heparan-alpha-glucosaminide N-acetyltransferase domain-containing protein [Candidatus Krumholzibacteria bacterium]MDH4338206.1 heparan-alpha-glucosaminide N-acetyltransferase domain-containing protein [Candidatus Krumholzibacteria bacterium]MDH5270881.1 heparan-alpha-glucosaminide N-acetyltransferase domain-containing protein [Candidatus Krumholzibacteria bacterium]